MQCLSRKNPFKRYSSKYLHQILFNQSAIKRTHIPLPAVAVYRVTRSIILHFADTWGHSGPGVSIKALKMDFDLERSLKAAFLPRALMPKAKLTIWHLRSIVIGGLSMTLSQREIRFKQHSSGTILLCQPKILLSLRGPLVLTK